MRGSDKAVVLGVVMAIVLAVFYFTVLSPKRDKASQLNKDVSGLKAQVAQEEQVAEFGDQARQQFPTYYGRLVVLGKAVPAGADTASLLVELNSIAHTSNVSFDGITLSANSSASASASSSATPTSGTSTAPTSTTGTSTTGTSTTPSSSGSSPAPTSGAATPTSAPATEASAANLPIGATVGPGGLAVMPYSLNFSGNYFQVADFLSGVDDLIRSHGTTVASDGRLLTIDGFALTDPQGFGPNPTLKVAVSVTSFVAPASQGLTAGASPSGPATSLTQPQAQPASATVAP